MIWLFALLILISQSQQTQFYVDGSDQKTIQVGRQVQIEADVTNRQDIEQNFAYIVQIQNEDDVTISLAWLTGSLAPAQSLSPAISWTPDTPGRYVATIFVWEGIDNPSPLSHTISMPITVMPQST
jgi:hypothetical protein